MQVAACGETFSVDYIRLNYIYNLGVNFDVNI